MDKKLKVCFDCINCEQCPTGLACSANPACTMFKDKSEWVHLPCNIGDRIFSIVIIGGEYTVVADRVHALKISEEDIYVDTNWYESGEIEYNVFLTQEEAEKALKLRKESDGK